MAKQRDEGSFSGQVSQKQRLILQWQHTCFLLAEFHLLFLNQQETDVYLLHWLIDLEDMGRRIDPQNMCARVSYAQHGGCCCCCLVIVCIQTLSLYRETQLRISEKETVEHRDRNAGSTLRIK